MFENKEKERKKAFSGLVGLGWVPSGPGAELPSDVRYDWIPKKKEKEPNKPTISSNDGQLGVLLSILRSPPLAKSEFLLAPPKLDPSLLSNLPESIGSDESIRTKGHRGIERSKKLLL